MKHYVTFGQNHVHNIAGRIVHKNLVVVFDVETPEEGREKAFEYFGDKFCFDYSEKHWDEDKMKYFPDGYLHLN